MVAYQKRSVTVPSADRILGVTALSANRILGVTALSANRILGVTAPSADWIESVTTTPSDRMKGRMLWDDHVGDRVRSRVSRHLHTRASHRQGI